MTCVKAPCLFGPDSLLKGVGIYITLTGGPLTIVQVTKDNGHHHHHRFSNQFY